MLEVREENNDEDEDKENEPFELTEDQENGAGTNEETGGEPVLPDILPGEFVNFHDTTFHGICLKCCVHII